MADMDDILKWVKVELIFNRLNLADMGYQIGDIQDTTPLFDEAGLNLDSVDGLELAIGIEQKLGRKIGKLTEAVSKNHFHSPATITNFIYELQRQDAGVPA